MERANGGERAASDGSGFPAFIHAYGGESRASNGCHTTLIAPIARLQWGLPQVFITFRPVLPGAMSNLVTRHRVTTTAASSQKGASVFLGWNMADFRTLHCSSVGFRRIEFGEFGELAKCASNRQLADKFLGNSNP